MSESFARKSAIQLSETKHLSLQKPQKISVLGATGSIGLNTLDLIGRTSNLFEVIALTAHSNVKKLAELALQHKAKFAVIHDETLFTELKSYLSGSTVKAAAGEKAILEAAAYPVDCVMAAIVGAAGLKPTFAAASQGCRIALANKECLVSAGNVFIDHIRSSNAELIPVDSEHSAAFQALAGAERSSVDKIVLTASGGPFRTWSKDQLDKAKPEEALRHPNWSMGAKITIDSATLMNKGLELIEAFHLFPVNSDQLDTIIHPQSIVHCLVYYIDGAIIAQLGPPDMRTPIAYALTWPYRRSTPTSQIDLTTYGSLTFESVNNSLFPAPSIAKDILKKGGHAATILNAANEVAVEAFLNRKLSFLDITRLVQISLERAEQYGLIKISKTLDDVLNSDQEGRKIAQSIISQGM